MDVILVFSLFEIMNTFNCSPKINSRSNSNPEDSVEDLGAEQKQLDDNLPSLLSCSEYHSKR